MQADDDFFGNIYNESFKACHSKIIFLPFLLLQQLALLCLPFLALLHWLQFSHHLIIFVFVLVLLLRVIDQLAHLSMDVVQLILNAIGQIGHEGRTVLLLLQLAK